MSLNVKHIRVMMAITIWFISSVLLALVLVAHALMDFSAFAHQQGKEINGIQFEASIENVFYVPKEITDATTSVVTRKIRRQLGGRKRLRVSGEASVLQRMLNGESAQNSDNNVNDVYDKFHHYSFKRSQNKDPAAEQERDEEERRQLLDETVYLMHRDYKRMDEPRRYPPVNNHEPTD